MAPSFEGTWELVFSFCVFAPPLAAILVSQKQIGHLGLGEVPCPVRRQPTRAGLYRDPLVVGGPIETKLNASNIEVKFTLSAVPFSFHRQFGTKMGFSV